MIPTPCLLCAAPAVADGLCVNDGARKWAAELWEREPLRASLRAARANETVLYTERLDALRYVCSAAAARAFLDHLAAKQEERTRREAIAAAEDARREAMR